MNVMIQQLVYNYILNHSRFQAARPSINYRGQTIENKLFIFENYKKNRFKKVAEINS